MGKNFTLSPQQHKAIQVLVETGSITDAAEAANRERRTVYLWLKQPEFQHALQAAEAQALTLLATRMANDGNKAAAALVDVLDDSESTNSEKIAAARVILGNLPPLRLLGSIESQIAKLMENEQ